MRVLPVLACGLASVLAGCGFVGKATRYVPDTGVGDVAEHPDPHAAYIVGDGSATVLTLEIDAVAVEIRAADHTRSTLLIGPIVPIVPYFLVGWMAPEPPSRNELTVEVEIAPGESAVAIDWGQTVLRIRERSATVTPDVARILAITGHRQESFGKSEGAPLAVHEYVDLGADPVRLDPARHVQRNGRYFLRFQFTVQQLDSVEHVELALGSLTVNEKPVALPLIRFDRREEWQWGISVINA